MKRSAILGVLVGAALVVALFATNDMAAIGAVVAGAGWGVLAVIALHLPQTFASGLAWRSLIVGRPPALGRLFLLRWVREAVNALLPVAQIGGDVVRARLLSQGGVPLAAAAASCTVDLAIEMATQVVFSLFGLALFLTVPQSRPARGAILAVMAAAALIAVSFMASQRFGLFKLLEPWLQKRSKAGRTPLGDLTGLNAAVVRLYRDPRRVLAASAGHLASWALGAVETWAALKVLGLASGWRAAVVIESLGQAVRGLGFLIPGALGVQEGGYILICGLFGLSAADALGLSLVRRLRELTLGLPGLWLWRRLERVRARRDVEPAAASA